MKIAVTQEHIDKGRPAYRLCPIARAMRDAGFEKPSVGRSTISWVDPETGMRKRKALTRRMAEFVNEFDLTWPFQTNAPFAFDFPAPATHDGPRRTVDAPAVHGGGRVVAE